MNIATWPVAGEREKELLHQIIDSGQWGGFHPMVQEFEAAFAAFQGCRFGVSTFNGTVSLEMLLAVAGIGAGDEVIVPAISFISTATAVSRCGAVPVFVDIAGDTFQMDPECVRKAITPKTRAILAVHFGGPMADVDALCAIAAGHGLPLIEDAAHAHGSEWNGRRAGSFGWAASFSFQNGKVMTSGEGGIVTTNDPGAAEACRSFANQGRRPGHSFFQHFTIATNFRLTALQAAVLTAQLERLPSQIETRAANAVRLQEALSGVEGLRFQQVPAEARRHSHYLLLCRVDRAAFGLDRDGLCAGLTEAGIPCTPFYPHTLYQNIAYRENPCRAMPCPVAEECIGDALWLPHKVLLSPADTLDTIASHVLAMHRRARGRG
jgi:dTDP-4-amino-4,6-dideoxygalactose transaminase